MRHYRYAIKQNNDILGSIHRNYLAYQSGLLCNKNETVYSVTFEECKKDGYDMVAWRNTGENKIDYIFKNTILLNTCFPYGIKPMLDNGKGSIIYLKIIDVRSCSTAKELGSHRAEWDLRNITEEQ